MAQEKGRRASKEVAAPLVRRLLAPKWLLAKQKKQKKKKKKAAAEGTPTLLSAVVGLYQQESGGSSSGPGHAIDASVFCDIVCTQLAGDAEDEAGTALSCCINLLVEQDPAFLALFEVRVTSCASVSRLAGEGTSVGREGPAWAGDLAPRLCTSIPLPAPPTHPGVPAKPTTVAELLTE